MKYYQCEIQATSSSRSRNIYLPFAITRTRVSSICISYSGYTSHSLSENK
jgi:hypothetical protein